MSDSRIRAARELLGLSQEELAGASNVSQGLISQVERGNKPVSDKVLEAIASGTGLPVAFFHRAPVAPKVDSLRFRKYRTAPSKATARTKRTFTELFDVSRLLMEKVCLPEAQLPLHRRSKDVVGPVIESLAVEVRAALRLSDYEPVRHLTRALERSNVPVAPIVFSDLSGEEVDEVAAVGHFGLSGRLESLGRSAITYFPSGGDRQRFTIAHELGHVIMHDAEVLNSREVEREADRFAGALLIPEKSAREVLGANLTLREYASAKAEWGISIQALVMRASHLGIIDDERRSSLFKQISARGWRHVEPVSVRNEEPALLGALLSRTFAGTEGLYRRASTGLGLPALQLRAMMPPPAVRSSPAGTAQSSVYRLPLRRADRGKG